MACVSNRTSLLKLTNNTSDNDPLSRFACSIHVDCAVCAENYTPGILRRCHKCSTAHRQLAIGLASALVIFASLAAVWLVPGPVQEGRNDARLRIRHTIASGYNFIMKALPMSAIKIVVVVLQIITQV